MTVPAVVFNSCVYIEDQLEGIVARLNVLDTNVSNPIYGFSGADKALISDSARNAEKALNDLRAFMANNDIPTVD